MSNSPHPEKRTLSVRVKRELYARIAKEAKSRKENISDFVSSTLYTATQNVDLTPEEIDQIRKDTENAERKKGHASQRK